MKVFKEFFIAMMIALAVPVLICLSFICYTTSFFTPNNYYKWVNEVKNIPTPEDSAILRSDDEMGNITAGSSEDQDYGAYWIIETKLTMEQLKSYYQPYIDKMNIHHVGYSSDLIINAMPDKYPFWFNELDEYIDNFDTGRKNVYIIYIVKCGRNFFTN